VHEIVHIVLKASVPEGEDYILFGGALPCSRKKQPAVAIGKRQKDRHSIAPSVTFDVISNNAFRKGKELLSIKDQKGKGVRADNIYWLLDLIQPDA